MPILTPDIVIRLIFVFWIPAQVGHFLGFIVANHDDIYIEWKTFYLGDLLSWGIVGLVSWGLANKGVEEWVYWLYFIGHAIIISTILSDVFLNQDTFVVPSFDRFMLENIKESIAVPWIVGIIFGIISILVFKI